MALPAGTYINAFQVTLPDTQEVTRIALPRPDVSRREMERQHHTRLFIHDGAAWTAKPLHGQPTVGLAPSEHLPVHLFNLREALRVRAIELRWDFWIRQGEMNAVRPEAREIVGSFVIQSVLKARAVWEGIQAKELLLVASSSVRWLVDRDLNDAAVQAVAVGEHVLRRHDVTHGPPRGRVTGFSNGEVLLEDRDGGDPRRVPTAGYQLVARPSLVHRLVHAAGGTPAEASQRYAELLAASGTLLSDRRTPNPYAAKQRFIETEALLDAFGRDLTLANGVTATISSAPREVFPVSGQAREPWSAARMAEPKLRFDAGITSRADTRAYQGLRTYGAYQLGLETAPRVLLAYPSSMHQEVDRFADKLLSGSGSYPGFVRLFGAPADHTPVIEHLRLPAGREAHNVRRLRTALDHWAAQHAGPEPDLAISVVPRTDRWETDTPYYVTKEFFAQRGTPSQMVTEELLHDTGRLGWSLANIALAAFAKLGGTPWVVDARGHDDDLVVGVGRADVADPQRGRHQTFGYAVAFVANGAYLATHSFPPAANEGDYEQRLTEAIAAALQGDRNEMDRTVKRVVIHLARRTGEREIRAAQRALRQAGMEGLPVAYLRIDDSSLFEFLDGTAGTYAPPKGLTLRLGERRALVQVETASKMGPARRPLLVELDDRSTVNPAEDFGMLVLEVFRLGHANWRGFNSRSKPVTLLYGEQLAELVGYINQRGTWDPATMRNDLRARPWFL